MLFYSFHKFSIFLLFLLITQSPAIWGSTQTTTKEEKLLLVSVKNQTLSLFSNGEIIKKFPISTSKNGVGNVINSFKTPTGLHRIRRKIGNNAPIGNIFKATIDTQKIAKIYTDKTDTDEDLILTRIMWLDGLEPGYNRGGKVDSFSRHIYIHGTNEVGLIGIPASDGCIRMNNEDVITLFNLVNINDRVLIQ